MKRFLLTSLLALPFLAAFQQRASAWCEVNLGAGFNLHIACSGCSWQFNCSRCQQPYPGCGDWYGNGGWCGDAGWGGYGYSGYGDVVAPSSTPSTPTPAPAQKTSYQGPAYPNWGYQPVGYYESPSYWYNR
jgi:hypothetical protein